MTQKDQMKLLEQGFKIIRQDISSLSIKIKEPSNIEWRRYSGPFKSKAQLRREMDELLLKSNIIED